MAPSPLQQRRTHNLLLFQRLLGLRDGASPFTLLLDTLEQSARGVVREFVARAKTSRTKIIFVSFETVRRPAWADVIITGRGKGLGVLRAEISSSLPSTPAPGTQPGISPSSQVQSAKTLLIIDTLHPLAAASPSQLPVFLSSLLVASVSVLATYHADIPAPTSSTSPSSSSTREINNPYAPSVLDTLTYLATAILTISSLDHVIERKKARDRSEQEPVFGMAEGREGVLVGIKKGHLGGEARGVVVEMEVRRKSGRGVKEIFVLTPPPLLSSITASTRLPPSTADKPPPRTTKTTATANIILLEDHPLYAPPSLAPTNAHATTSTEKTNDSDVSVETTFSLSLTDRERRDRDAVVLPYFDAQNEGGIGEGGRILYEMDRGDDFDEEEDEI